MAKERKYLTVERFEKFINNDFYHLKYDMKSTKWLLRVLVGGLIIVTVIERLFN